MSDIKYVDLNEAFEDVDVWNVQAGSKSKDFDTTDLLNQSKLVLEEAKETFEAISLLSKVVSGEVSKESLQSLPDDYNPALETVDGVMDLFFVSLRLLAMIEDMGFNTGEAWDKVVKSNNSKLLTQQPTLEDVKYYSEKYNTVITVAERIFGDETYYTLRDENNKIRKPDSFVAVDLKDCVPEYLLGVESGDES